MNVARWQFRYKKKAKNKSGIMAMDKGFRGGTRVEETKFDNKCGW